MVRSSQAVANKFKKSTETTKKKKKKDMETFTLTFGKEIRELTDTSRVFLTLSIRSSSLVQLQELLSFRAQKPALGRTRHSWIARFYLHSCHYPSLQHSPLLFQLFKIISADLFIFRFLFVCFKRAGRGW